VFLVLRVFWSLRDSGNTPFGAAPSVFQISTRGSSMGGKLFRDSRFGVVRKLLSFSRASFCASCAVTKQRCRTVTPFYRFRRPSQFVTASTWSGRYCMCCTFSVRAPRGKVQKKRAFSVRACFLFYTVLHVGFAQNKTLAAIGIGRFQFFFGAMERNSCFWVENRPSKGFHGVRRLRMSENGSKLVEDRLQRESFLLLFSGLEIGRDGRFGDVLGGNSKPQLHVKRGVLDVLGALGSDWLDTSELDRGNRADPRRFGFCSFFRFLGLDIKADGRACGIFISFFAGLKSCGFFARLVDRVYQLTWGW